MIKQFFNEFLGGLTTNQVIISFILAFAGLYLKWYFKSYVGVHYNAQTPYQFSWKYWLSDNVHRLKGMVATIIILFISIRFPKELLGVEFSYLWAFIAGLGIDWITEVIKKKTENPLGK